MITLATATETATEALSASSAAVQITPVGDELGMLGLLVRGAAIVLLILGVVYIAVLLIGISTARRSPRRCQKHPQTPAAVASPTANATPAAVEILPAHISASATENAPRSARDFLRNPTTRRAAIAASIIFAPPPSRRR